MRQEKQLLLDEIKEQIDGSEAMVLTSYGKLNPDLAETLRGKSRRSWRFTFSVIRKRVLIKAAAESAGSYT